MMAHAPAVGFGGLEAYSFVDNPASARVLAKAGFADHGVVRRDYPERGGLRQVRRFERRVSRRPAGPSAGAARRPTIGLGGRPMEYRKLGRSGLKVSPLCLGTMMFGGPTDEPTSARIIARAKDAGINFIDTADVYNEGRSEEVVGRALAPVRDHWVLATKMATRWGRGRTSAGCRAAGCSRPARPRSRGSAPTGSTSCTSTRRTTTRRSRRRSARWRT